MVTNIRDQAEFRRSRRLESEGFRHAFFTRNGGVSEGPYATLNFSSAAGDSVGNVTRNLERAAVALGVAPERIYFLSQVHGTCVVTVHGHEDRARLLFEEGDAVASVSPAVACGVRIADCVPVLVADTQSGAAVAIHAGWRGVVRGVIRAGVERLRELGGDHGRMIAAIGPHIGPTAFEVGEDVCEEIVRASPDAHVVSRAAGEKPKVDLSRVVRAQLVALGLAADDVDQVAGCTMTDPDLFSFRRDGKASGRHLAAIVPRGRE